ncbi:TetR/AcrR family transcriptional regulator [Peterkaempfera bronchialis]|uniref:TetR family transcriptional regulator n=1 Tax=Peterkaempfera bronchialis TaxID=2126346 RepID=A0A345T4K1_9ACTN|nr:TetR/AcrR family transcriptional regulator [Peterkaempfera bronchialis]AXI80906.1 TetR family transcriptional regulator [Peterkaempfera bronchialis]
MPPAKTDHAARRRDVSEAVWKVMASQGFGGLTLRAVAAQLGASTGLVTHYFPSKQALVAHALAILEERTEQRPRRVPPAEGIAALRTALLDILPLSAPDTVSNRIWVGSWDTALADPQLGADQAARDDRSRARLRRHVEAAQQRGELPADADPERLAVMALAFTHGLVVQALFSPALFPPERQQQLVDDFLAALRAQAVPGAGSAGQGPEMISPL